MLWSLLLVQQSLHFTHNHLGVICHQYILILATECCSVWFMCSQAVLSLPVEYFVFQEIFIILRTDVMFSQSLTIKVKGFCVANRQEPAAFKKLVGKWAVYIRVGVNQVTETSKTDLSEPGMALQTGKWKMEVTRKRS